MMFLFKAEPIFRFHVYFWGGSTANQLRYIPYAHTYIYICICICIYIYIWMPRLPKKTPGEIPPLGFFAAQKTGVENHPAAGGLELVGGSGCWSLVAWEFLLRSRLGGDFFSPPTKKNHQHIFLGQILSEFGGYKGGFQHFMWKNMNLKIARYIFGAPFKSGRVEMFMIYILWGTPWTSHEQRMKSSKLQGKSSSVRWGKTSHPIGSMGLVYLCIYLLSFGKCIGKCTIHWVFGHIQDFCRGFKQTYSKHRNRHHIYKTKGTDKLDSEFSSFPLIPMSSNFIPKNLTYFQKVPPFPGSQPPLKKWWNSFWKMIFTPTIKNGETRKPTSPKKWWLDFEGFYIHL